MATGAPFWVRLLELLRDSPDVETHLVMSRWARTTIELETPYTAREVAALADVVHGSGTKPRPSRPGSFRTDGMVIAPCSMKTLAGIRTGYAEGLVCRAADVVLKERRRLVLVPRETPLSEIHLENMLELARKGAQMVPPMPAFYNHPKSVDDIVDHVAVRVLDQFGIEAPVDTPRWSGLPHPRRPEVAAYGEHVPWRRCTPQRCRCTRPAPGTTARRCARAPDVCTALPRRRGGRGTMTTMPDRPAARRADLRRPRHARPPPRTPRTSSNVAPCADAAVPSCRSARSTGSRSSQGAAWFAEERAGERGGSGASTSSWAGS